MIRPADHNITIEPLVPARLHHVNGRPKTVMIYRYIDVYICIYIYVYVYVYVRGLQAQKALEKLKVDDKENVELETAKAAVNAVISSDQ